MQRYVRALPRASAVVLLLLPLAVTGWAMLTGRVFGPIDLAYVSEPFRPMADAMGVRIHNANLGDVYSEMMPWRKALQFAIAHRQWPLLDPFLLSGSQLAGAAQPAVFHPLTLIACLLPVGASFTFTAAITFFVAGLGAYLFAREIDCGEGAALFAAAGWMFSTPIAFFVQTPMAMSWALLPLVLVGTRRVIGGASLRNAALLTAAFSLLLLSGHPETAFHVVMIAVAFAISEVVRLRGGVVKPLAYAAGAGLAALALCAVQVLMLLEGAPQTVEYHFRHNYYALQDRASHPTEMAARVATDLFPYLESQKWIARRVRAVSADSFGVGSIVWALAIYALWRARGRHKWFLAALALFGVLARASWGPLMNALRRLPLFDQVVNERFAIAAAFALVMLAASAIEELRRRDRDRALAFTLLATFAMLVIGGLLIDRAHVVERIPRPWLEYVRVAEVVGLGLAAMLAFARARPAIPLLLALLVTQRYAEVGRITPTLPAGLAHPRLAILDGLRRTDEPFRFVGQGFTFVPNGATQYELEDVRGYEALTFARMWDVYSLWCVHQPVWFNRVDDLTRPFLSLMNVRYAMQSASLPVPEGWRLAGGQPGTVLLENTRALPRAFIPRTLRFLAVDGASIAEMRYVPDFGERAWINDPSFVPHEETNGSGTLRTRRNGLELAIDADMTRDAWVVISEAAWKGWRVYIDGKRVRWFYADHTFLGVHVPAGHHELRVVYLPRSFVVGGAISMATALGMVALAIVRRRRKSQIIVM